MAASLRAPPHRRPLGALSRWRGCSRRRPHGPGRASWSSSQAASRRSGSHCLSGLSTAVSAGRQAGPWAQHLGAIAGKRERPGPSLRSARDRASASLPANQLTPSPPTPPPRGVGGGRPSAFLRARAPAAPPTNEACGGAGRAGPSRGGAGRGSPRRVRWPEALCPSHAGGASTQGQVLFNQEFPQDFLEESMPQSCRTTYR